MRSWAFCPLTHSLMYRRAGPSRFYAFLGEKKCAFVEKKTQYTHFPVIMDLTTWGERGVSAVALNTKM